MTLWTHFSQIREIRFHMPSKGKGRQVFCLCVHAYYKKYYIRRIKKNLIKPASTHPFSGGVGNARSLIFNVGADFYDIWPWIPRCFGKSFLQGLKEHISILSERKHVGLHLTCLLRGCRCSQGKIISRWQKWLMWDVNDNVLKLALIFFPPFIYKEKSLETHCFIYNFYSSNGGMKVLSVGKWQRETRWHIITDCHYDLMVSVSLSLWAVPLSFCLFFFIFLLQRRWD